MSPPPDPTLPGKVALVTGGARGLGRAIAAALAGAGCKVFLTGRSAEDLAQATDTLTATGAEVASAAADVTDTGAMADAVAACATALGPIDILVNNSGISADGPVASADIEEWWRVLEVNLKGPLIASRLVLPGMIARGRGHVINIGSYMANRAAPMVSAYATSKAALLRLTDSLAAEVQAEGVTVLALSPGFVPTDMGRAVEAGMKASVPGFDGFSDEAIFGPEAIAALVCRVAEGAADAFHGRMLHVKDDLDALIAAQDAILAEGRFVLTFKT